MVRTGLSSPPTGAPESRLPSRARPRLPAEDRAPRLARASTGVSGSAWGQVRTPPRFRTVARQPIRASMRAAMRGIARLNRFPQRTASGFTSERSTPTQRTTRLSSRSSTCSRRVGSARRTRSISAACAPRRTRAARFTARSRRWSPTSSRSLRGAILPTTAWRTATRRTRGRGVRPRRISAPRAPTTSVRHSPRAFCPPIRPSRRGSRARAARRAR
jgi:hypothetical protein